MKANETAKEILSKVIRELEEKGDWQSRNSAMALAAVRDLYLPRLIEKE